MKSAADDEVAMMYDLKFSGERDLIVLVVGFYLQCVYVDWASLKLEGSALFQCGVFGFCQLCVGRFAADEIVVFLRILFQVSFLEIFFYFWIGAVFLVVFVECE